MGLMVFVQADRLTVSPYSRAWELRYDGLGEEPGKGAVTSSFWQQQPPTEADARSLTELVRNVSEREEVNSDRRGAVAAGIEAVARYLNEYLDGGLGNPPQQMTGVKR